jgi:hypothetical protein
MSKHFEKELQILLEQYPVNRTMREAARRSKQARLIAESREPQTGCYWWIPRPTGWVLYEFFDSQYGETMHEEIWRKYLAPTLFERPSKNLLLAYAGLPRGRVSKIAKGRFAIYHGKDAPSKLSHIPSKFNLAPKTYSLVFDVHEQMIPEHYYVIKKLLPHDLPPPKSIGYADYEDLFLP